MTKDRLGQFSGTECVHCREMDPIIRKVEKELGVKIHYVEVWHNEENAKFMESVDTDGHGKVFCGGVPLFYNEKTGKKICGSCDFETLKNWALGK